VTKKTVATDVIDRELLAAFRAGHRDALERIYREHASQLAAFLRTGFMYTSNDRPQRFRGVRDSFELESLVQEVFARAFAEKARLAFDGVRPYAGFLAGIARNVVLDALRRELRHGEVLVAPDVLDGHADAQGSLDREATADEQRGSELVARFLETECDARDRSLYELRFTHELTQVQAAEAARLSRIQIRRWETKFRARLLRFLKRADYVREP
jgi:RNA polymerase sigma factor (sigma-70 family)